MDIRQKEWTVRDTGTLASSLLLAFGGVMAWGLGGLMFGLGVWLAIILAIGDIEEAIKRQSHKS